MTVLGGGAFGKWLCHKGGTLMIGISALIKETQRTDFSFLLLEDTVRSLQAQGGPSSNHGVVILDFFNPKLWEMSYVVYKPPDLWQFCIALLFDY